MRLMKRRRYEWTCTLCGATGTQASIESPTAADHYYRFHYTPPAK